MNAMAGVAKREPAGAGGIPRVEGLDPKTFHRRYAGPGVPVLLPGFARDWPAVRAWSLESLAAEVGNVKVPVQVLEKNVARRVIQPFNASVRAMLDPARAATQHYIQQISLRGLPGSVHSALQSIEEYLGPRYPVGRRYWRDEARLWIGPAGTVTPVHFDLAHNFYVQLVGRKRFTLFDPGQSAALRYPDYSQDSLTASGVNVERPDLARYPEFATTRPVVIDLTPGDAMFLPHSWWHHVRSLDPAVSLSRWWLSAGMLLSQWRYWFHRFRRDLLRARGRTFRT